MKASVKYMVIYRHKEKYSISEMCRFFEGSRGGYYVKRMDTPDRDTELAELIVPVRRKPTVHTAIEESRYGWIRRKRSIATKKTYCISCRNTIFYP